MTAGINMAPLTTAIARLTSVATVARSVRPGRNATVMGGFVPFSRPP